MSTGSKRKHVEEALRHNAKEPKMLIPKQPTAGRKRMSTGGKRK